MSKPKLNLPPNVSTRLPRAAASIVIIATGLWALPAAAWWGDGHAILSRAAIFALPAQVPSFFRAGGETVAHLSYDPDVAKNRGAALLSHGEFPEHFFDIELLQGTPFPDKRYEFIALCQRLGVAPEKVGFAPYAIAEWTQRLALAFAEHRRWPRNEIIRSKCLLYAGILAHYAEDIVQPLHATIHYDGRVGEGGTVQYSGIHETVDSIVERLRIDPSALADRAQVAPFAEGLFPAIRQQVLQSNGQVDGLYELVDELDPISDQGRAFALERARRATSFTASLYVTAWELSRDLHLPGWLQR